MEKHPYELLIRWDADGRLQGAHVQFRYVYRDENGNLLGEQIGPAEPVAAAGNPGFPLDELLTAAQRDAIAAANLAIAENASLQTALSMLRETQTEIISVLAAAAEDAKAADAGAAPDDLAIAGRRAATARQTAELAAELETQAAGVAPPKTLTGENAP